MKVGYVRVSTIDQNESRQMKRMKEMGIEKIYLEKSSAKDIEGRPELKNLLEFVREGDTIYVHDFSRLARSTKDLLNITEILAKKKVDLVSFKENIDTSTPTGKLMLTMIGAINEFERTNLLERQKEGIFIAKELGKYKGRKPIPFPENWETIYPSWKNREMTGVAAMKLLKLKRCTFYKLIKDWEERENSRT
ncbi:MAG: recombinase family protein [Cetobacterium sp.]|uniref:recombinase family protein n=1 Tax=Cetobacterium sp. TaxID=2071632 RepID=UPI003EE42E6C